MSVILKISRIESPERVVEVRGLCMEIGEDRQGILCTKNPAHHFYSLFEIEGRYRLVASRRGIYTSTTNNNVPTPLIPGDSLWVIPGDILTIDDTTFALFPISADSEALAHTTQRPLEILSDNRSMGRIPRMRFTIYPSHREITLYPNVVYSVGRDSKNGVVLDIAGVAARHVDLIYRGQGIEIVPRLGKVALNGAELTQATTLLQNGSVALLPTGIVLSIEIT